MPGNHVDVVLVHGAWADGSSWGKVIGPLKADGFNVVAAPLPLTSLADDVVALDRVLEKVDGPAVVAGRPLWKDRPSWFLIAEDDRMIAPDTERFMAVRMGARARSRPVDHTPLVTAPEDVVDIIRDAAADVASPA